MQPFLVDMAVDMMVDTGTDMAHPCGMVMWSVQFGLRVNLDDPELLRLVIRAEALARTIRGIPLPPGVWNSINRLNIARAVRGTTGIEGSRLDEGEVARILAGPADVRVLPPSREREESEARNAAAVMGFIEETIGDDAEAPLSEATIREVHRRTTIGIPYEANVPGQYRSHAANAGDYVPPRTAEEVTRLMAEFVVWLHSGAPARWPPLVRAIAAHFYLVSIHPFGDGNGRTARAIESFLLYQGDINPVGFYSLANFYYQHRARYIMMLDWTRFDSGSDLTPFITWAAEGLVEELERVHSEVVAHATLVAFRDYARELLAGQTSLNAEARERCLALILGLGAASVPLADIRAGKHAAGFAHRSVTTRTLSRDVQLLERLGLIAREEGSLRAKLEVMQHYRAGRSRT